MNRFLFNKRSRAGMLVVAAALVGGTGCFMERMLHERSHREARARAEAELAGLRAGAARGEPKAMTELGWGQVSGGVLGIPFDRAEGLAWLEKAAARDHYPARYALAKGLVTGPGATAAERARGLELFKLAASRSCALSIWKMPPALEVGMLLRDGGMEGIPRDPAEAELWIARSIVHCNHPNDWFSSLVAETVTEPARTQQLLAWANLANYPGTPPGLYREPTAQQLQAAAQDAERLRRRVRESEQRYPAPPPLPSKP